MGSVHCWCVNRVDGTIHRALDALLLLHLVEACQWIGVHVAMLGHLCFQVIVNGFGSGCCFGCLFLIAEIEDK